MNLDDMILVSIDDHMIEPPHMFENHVPKKWLNDAPKVVHEDGIDQWVFQGEKTSTSFGMAATVGWPSEEWGFNPGTYTELRPGCFDVHERVRDMNANGVLGSMCFPTMAGWNARTFAESRDKEIALVMLQAYNDWAIDEWCGAYPGRFIPLGIVPMWDVDAAVAEVRRIAKKGCRSISFLETPHVQGFPSFLSGYWDPMLAALSEENMVLSLHIGAGFAVIQRAEEAPVDHLMVLACQISAITAQDLLFGPTLRRFPDLKVALSEGGIGWIPFYFDRIDRHFGNQEWLHSDFGGKLPSEVFRDHILACYITDPSGLLLRDRIGIDIIAWECDYPHTDTTWPESPEFAWKEFQDAGVPRRRDPQDHLGERLPLLRLGPLRAHTQGAGDRRRAAWRRPRRRRHPHVPRRVAQAQRGRRRRHRRRRLTSPRTRHPIARRRPVGLRGLKRASERAPGSPVLLNLSDDQQFFRETTDRFLTEQAPPDAVRALRHDATGFGPPTGVAGPSWDGPRCWSARSTAAGPSAGQGWSISASWPTRSAATPRRDRWSRPTWSQQRSAPTARHPTCWPACSRAR